MSTNTSCSIKNVCRPRIDPRTTGTTGTIGVQAVRPMNLYSWVFMEIEWLSYNDLIQRGKLLSRKDSNLFE